MLQVAPSAEFENLESCGDVCVNKFPCFPIIPPAYDPRFHDGECIGMFKSQEWLSPLYI